MVTQSSMGSTIQPVSQRSVGSGLEGIIAGTIGAATLAIWFLILDTVYGRPLYTPAVLGQALFHRGETESLHVPYEAIIARTWVHWLVFVMFGIIASRLLKAVERNPDLGFGVLLLFVVFEFGFVGVTTLLAEPVLQALTWPAVLIGNLLTAIAMGGYFWSRHRHMTINPASAPR